MDNKKTEQKKMQENSNYCIFEKKICRHANKEGSVFDCKAPSDFEMTCNK